jgi:hypothetical protein
MLDRGEVRNRAELARELGCSTACVARALGLGADNSRDAQVPQQSRVRRAGARALEVSGLHHQHERRAAPEPVHCPWSTSGGETAPDTTIVPPHRTPSAEPGSPQCLSHHLVLNPIAAPETAAPAPHGAGLNPPSRCPRVQTRSSGRTGRVRGCWCHPLPVRYRGWLHRSPPAIHPRPGGGEGRTPGRSRRASGPRC